MLRNSVEYPASQEISQNIHPITPRKKKPNHVLKINCSGLGLTKEKSFDPGFLAYLHYIPQIHITNLQAYRSLPHLCFCFEVHFAGRTEVSSQIHKAHLGKFCTQVQVSHRNDVYISNYCRLIGKELWHERVSAESLTSTPYISGRFTQAYCQPGPVAGEHQVCFWTIPSSLISSKSNLVPMH